MKATLTLKNGVQVNFECQPSELSTVLSGFDNVSKAVREDITNVKVPGVKIPTAKKGAYHKARLQTPWTDRDILAIGKIIYENLHLNSGITTLVRKYIRNDADVRNRTEATLASVTSDIKLYLRTGDKKKANGKVRSVLDAHGIFPKPIVKSNYLNLEEA